MEIFIHGIATTEEGKIDAIFELVKKNNTMYWEYKLGTAHNHYHSSNYRSLYSLITDNVIEITGIQGDSTYYIYDERIFKEAVNEDLQNM